MTGKDLWEQYQHYTRDITEHGRKLGLAGAAICWIFKTVDFTFPFCIYLALLFFVGYFLTDIFHSLIGAFTVKIFTQREEKKLWEKTGSIEGEISKPRWVDYPALFFFVVKCILLIVGFFFIGCELLKRLIH